MGACKDPAKLWKSIKKALKLLSLLDAENPTVAKLLVLLTNPENNEENI